MLEREKKKKSVLKLHHLKVSNAESSVPLKKKLPEDLLLQL